MGDLTATKKTRDMTDTTSADGISIEHLGFASSSYMSELIRRNLDPFIDEDNTITSSFRRLENMYETYQQNGSFFFVARDAENAGKYVGGVGLGALHGLPVSEGFGEIRDLVVEKNYRGLGIGARLLGIAIDRAVSFGYKKLYLETAPSMHRAQKLFHRFGFRPVHNLDEVKLKSTSHKQTIDKQIDCYYLLEVKDHIAKG